MAGGFERTGGKRGKGYRGKLEELGEGALDGVKPAFVVDSGKILPPFLAEVDRLNERDPGSCRESVGDVADLRGVVERGEARDGEVVPAVAGALGFRVEGADRLDLVAEEFEANRLGGVGREEVDDPAA